MTGLLHRLAARATGTMVAVRSDARLPFSSPASFAATAGVPVPAAPAPDSRARPFAVTPPRDADAPARTDAPVPPLHSSDGESHAWTPAAVHRDTPTSVFAAERPAVHVAVPSPMVHVPAEERREERRLVPSVEIVAPVRGSAHEDTDPAGRERTVRIVREPPLLIPLATPDRTDAAVGLRPASMPPRHAGAQPEARADTADVHIHVGRIEVTAVHEPAPPRRQPRPGPEPMSLDTYLAKRGRG